MNHTSPPLPNLHSLSISPPPGSYPAPIQTNNNNNYRYNGVFGPPSQGSTVSPPDWATSPKRASRSGIPQGWYDPNAPPSRESPNLNAFEAFRRDAPSPPALSPPSSITSVPTTASSHPYQSYQQPSYPPIDNFGPMAVTPSPPPMPYGLNTAASAPNLSGFNAGGLPQFGSQSLASLSNNNNRSQANGWRNGYGMPSIPSSDEDVIPTAIVIKNIPFAVTRETLLGVMESLGAPLPYAFNYHHDNGVFRGLAFANFRLPDEAASVVAALNGYDVQGRKLRVEYKKVLQPGEKDKIEREKALKRMRSIQFDKSDLIPPPINTLRENQSRPLNTNGNGYDNNSPPQSATSTNSDTLPAILDMNDPASLDIYSRVLVFKEDRMRDELAFSKNLTPTERRIVHLVAQKLGLSSSTRGEGDSKSVVVLREAPPRPTLTSSSSATVSSSSYLSPYSTTPTNDLSPNLRIKKSMPDLRGFNGPVVARDPARSLNPQRSSGNLRADAGGRDYVSMGAAGGRRVVGGYNSNFNGNGLNSGTGSFNSLFGSSIGDIPPVPPLPSGLGGFHSKGHSISTFSSSGINDPMSEMLSSSSASNNTQPLRNPRGPAGESRGFGGSGTLRPSSSISLMNRNGAGGSSGGSGSSMLMNRRVSEEDEEIENSSIGGSVGSNSAVGSERHAAMNQNQNQNQINGNGNGISRYQDQNTGFMEGMRTRESFEV